MQAQSSRAEPPRAEPVQAQSSRAEPPRAEPSRARRRQHTGAPGPVAWVWRLFKNLLTGALFAALVASAAFIIAEWRIEEALLAVAPADGRDASELDRLEAMEHTLDSLRDRVETLEGQTALDRPSMGLEEESPELVEAVADLDRRVASLETALEIALAGESPAPDAEVPSQGLSPDTAPGPTAAATAASLLAVTGLEEGALLALQNNLLKARVELADGNRGRARQELDLATGIADHVLERLTETAAAPREPGTGDDDRVMWWRQIMVQIERIRLEIGLATPTAVDRLELLWHAVYAHLMGLAETPTGEPGPGESDLGEARP